MKRMLIIILLLILFIPSSVLATSGYLRTDSVKVCPNGKRYGQHGDGHWHLAKVEGDRYKAVGSPIKKDPCPPKSSDNYLETLKIDGKKIDFYYYDTNINYETYNKSIKIETKTSDSKAKAKNDYNGLKEGNNIITITVTAENGDKREYKLNVLLKKMDTSIKEIKVDSEKLEIKDTMNYETYNSDVKIEVVPNSPEVVVSNNYEKLVEGENTITIKLTATNGDVSEYKLIILKRKKDTSIKEFKINGDILEVSEDMNYETYSKKIEMEVIPNDPEVIVTNDYKELVEGENVVTIKLTAQNGDESEYKLNVLLKKRDMTIKSIKINDNEIEILETMHFETYLNDINIEVIPNDSLVTVSNDYKALEYGENVITIKLVLDEDEKEYKLVVNRLHKDGPGEVVFTKFILGEKNIEFENNNATFQIENDKSLKYSYELSDENAKLKMYLNEKSITKINSLKDGDVIKLVVIDKYDNEQVYYIKTIENSSIPGYAIYGPIALAAAGTGTVVAKKRKKKS